MLPKLHKRYSKAVLDEFRLPKAAKEQVVLGSIVNDYCELTNDGQIFLDKDTASSHILNTDLFKGKSAIWQSHFGYLTSLHFMSKEKGEPASVTADELKLWFKFLNVATGRISVAANSVIAADDAIISSMFTNGKNQIIIQEMEAGIWTFCMKCLNLLIQINIMQINSKNKFVIDRGG